MYGKLIEAEISSLDSILAHRPLLVRSLQRIRHKSKPWQESEILAASY